MATPISKQDYRSSCGCGERALAAGTSPAMSRSRALPITITIVLCATLPLRLHSSEESGQRAFAERARDAYLTTKKEFKANPDNAETALRMAVACFNWAGYQNEDKDKAEIAKEGISVSQRLLRLEPKSAAGHYYLGMNQGRLAQTKKLGALKLVDEMEDEFKTARELDEDLNFAGPDRNLGLLYRDAPGWPASIGSRSKAKHHLQQAVILAPNYPENRLNLIEAYLKWGESENAQREIKNLDKIWDEARKRLGGEKWEADWADWEMRRDAIAEHEERSSPALHIQRGGR